MENSLMGKPLDKTLCTNAEWLGRSHCDKCHIRQLMFFSELPDSAFGNLLKPIDHYIYPPGTVLYEAKSQKKFLYSIRRGMVKLVHEAQDGTRRIVRLLGPGAAIGLELLDGNAGYHHTAIAVDQVDLCKIPVETTRQLQSHYPALCKHVGEQLQEQLDLADQWIVALSTGTAKQRVAQLLLIMDEFFADENDSFILLNREDMAAMISISVETVSRMIAAFKRQKILKRYKDNRYQCNVTALQEITRFG
jgi:CRP-like cAMP-binding protein